MKNSSIREPGKLHELAELYRVEHEYWDGLGEYRQAPPEAILQVLRSLGAQVEGEGDFEEAIRERRREVETAVLEAVSVCRSGGRPQGLPIRLKSRLVGKPIAVSLYFEGGARREWSVCPEDLRWLRDFSWDGEDFQIRELTIEAELPLGYHKLVLEGSELRAESLLIVSPDIAYQSERGKTWGIFAPLYSLYSERSWGSASFRELGRMIDWTAAQGGGFVGTLPLYASFLNVPLAPSPYTPVSRLFWNEFFVDPRESPHWDRCLEAREIAASVDFQRSAERLREAPLVDYRREMTLRRRVLEALSRSLTPEGEDGGLLDRFCESNEEALNYARFRALHEELERPWREWPERFRKGSLREGEGAPDLTQYHLYVQWLAQKQLSSVLDSARNRGVGLYLDLPLGVHPDGYDVWSRPHLFAAEVSGGAPADGFFTAGQDWGFPPLHPETQRVDGYRFYRMVLGKLLGSSDLIRIDHAMSLQRLFWVPRGMTAQQGVYVYYPMEELFAILTLESHRQECVVVGEDLGTVSDEVRQTMDERGIYRMYVGQFEVDPSQSPPVSAVPRKRVASLNTHDTPTAAGFWQGRDIEDRLDLGLLDETEAEREQVGRGVIRQAFLRAFGRTGGEKDPAVQRAVLEDWLELLAASDAEFVLVNLEDLWQAEEPQNVPGTVEERPNWKRRAPESMESLCKRDRLLDTLQTIDGKRRE